MLRLLRIARREYLSYLKTPGFWLSLLVAPLIGGISSYAPTLMEKSAPVRQIVVMDYAHAGPAFNQALTAGARAIKLAVAAPPADLAAAPDAETARAAVKPYISGDRFMADGKKMDAAVILTGTPAALAVDLWTRDIADPGLSSAVNQAAGKVQRAERLTALGIDPDKLAAADASPTVREFSPKAASGGRVSLNDRLPTYVALALAFLLWTLVITGASILLSSVIEEKSNRVLEVLLSSASVAEILGGKILGVAALAATILAMWGTAGVIAITRLAPPEIAHQLLDALIGRGLILEFAVFFVLGYLMYASIFVAIGAFCETPREAQTLVGPLMVILSLPIVFLSQAIRRPDTPFLHWLSWFPPFTPFLMIVRVTAGAPAWEIAGTVAMMVVTAAVVVWFSARAFRAGALSTAKFDIPAFFKGIANAGR
jgi:ABC-2 type transport system permease protein